MPITSLAYIGVRSTELDDWRKFAGSLLGMQCLDRAGKTLAMRMDNHAQRLVVSNETGDTIAFIGWEVDAVSELDRIAAVLEDAGHAVERGSRELAARRFVDELIVCHDPAGYRTEIVWQPCKVDDPFEPGRAISGFKTGPMGMGHVVLHVPDANAIAPFYCDLLGFSITDFGLQPVPLYFFHINERHHSFAIVGSGKGGFHHFMVEYHNLDDVGQGYDLAQLEKGRIAYTLGRHTNDYMTSFYAHTPSQFFVESGWGGRMIEPQTWQAEETTLGPSFWGHDRLYLEHEQREQFKHMRMQAAANGKRTPHLINCPWLYRGD